MRKSKRFLKLTGSFCALCMAAAFFCTSPVSAATTRKVGDVDGDGQITASDALLVQRYSVGLEKLDDDAKKAADADFDGSITASDALVIQRASVKLAEISPFKETKWTFTQLGAVKTIAFKRPFDEAKIISLSSKWMTANLNKNTSGKYVSVTIRITKDDPNCSRKTYVGIRVDGNDYKIDIEKEILFTESEWISKKPGSSKTIKFKSALAKSRVSLINSTPWIKLIYNKNSSGKYTGFTIQTTNDSITTVRSATIGVKIDGFVDNVYVEEALVDGTFRKVLTTEEQFIYDKLDNFYVQKKNRQNMTINISSQEISNAKALSFAQKALEAFKRDNPSFFWVDFKTPEVKKGANVAESITFVVSETYSNAYNDINKVNSGITAAVNQIKKDRKSDSRIDTVKAIHDYICGKVSYLSVNSSQKRVVTTIAPLFGCGDSNKCLNCVGYAYSFKLLCSKFNIPCIIATGNYKAGAHAWNYVQMDDDDGKWYGVDVCWDDGDSVKYTYFVKDQASFGTHSVYDIKPGDWKFIYPDFA